MINVIILDPFVICMERVVGYVCGNTRNSLILS